MNQDINHLSQQLGTLLAARNMQIATAESCTGGGLAAAITAVAGSSAWFQYGIVSYANVAKTKLLKVSPETLASCGAVSEEVVTEMAEGALNLAEAQLAVAISGIAGPSGGEIKPVGTVWFCWQLATGYSITQCCQFSGNRHEVQRQAVARALAGAIEILLEAQKNTV